MTYKGVGDRNNRGMTYKGVGHRKILEFFPTNQAKNANSSPNSSENRVEIANFSQNLCTVNTIHSNKFLEIRVFALEKQPSFCQRKTLLDEDLFRIHAWRMWHVCVESLQCSFGFSQLY